MTELEEGGMFDEETMPEWMRNMRGVVSRSMDCMVYGSSVAISRSGMRSVVNRGVVGRSMVSRGVVIHISMVVRHMVRGMCRSDIGRFLQVNVRGN